MSTLRNRLIVSITLLVATVSFGLAWHVIEESRDALHVEVQGRLWNQVGMLAAMVDKQSPAYEPMFNTMLRPEVSGLFLMVYDRKGDLLGKSTGATLIPGVTEAVRQQKNPFVRPLLEERPMAAGVTFLVASYPLYRIDGTNAPLAVRTAGTRVDPSDSDKILGWVQGAIRLEAWHQRERTVQRNVLFGAFIATVLAGLLTAWATHRWLAEVHQTAEMAGRLVSDSESADLTGMRLMASGSDADLVRLVTAFNALLERIGCVKATQDQFVADAAHELRTPLTILRAEIQIALRQERDGSRYREVLNSSLEEVVRLARLVENLLTLARADAGRAVGVISPVEVGKVVTSVCESMRISAESVRVDLEVENQLGAEVRILADDVALRRILTNLVENALRHSPPGEAVTIRIDHGSAGGTKDTSQVQLAVEDRGIGIPAEHRDRVFERFYRIDRARARGTGSGEGTGLGLSIVKTLTQAMGGEVRLMSEVGVGTTVVVSFRAASEVPLSSPVG